MGAPVAIFDVDVELLLALERALGPPIDSYLMGWQVWLEPVEDPDQDVELEYRLHPPGGFEQPAGLSHHELWDEVIEQVAAGRDTFELGDETRDLDGLWVLLEVYPGFGGDIAPAQVREWAEAVLGRPALACGEVDHRRLEGRFRDEQHEADLPAALRETLGA